MTNEIDTPTPAIGHVAHFAINADDLPATRRFYESTVGWRFEAWGPPEFFHIYTSSGERPGAIGALQGRRDLGDGVRPVGFECTVAVDDVDAAVDRATAAGGTVLMLPTTITGVGHLAFVQDPSGNPVGLMHYDSDAS